MSVKSQAVMQLAVEKAPVSSPTSASSPATVPAGSRKKIFGPKFAVLWHEATASWDAANRLFDHRTDQFIPAACAGNPDTVRRARLICRFGFLGAAFGAIYAVFYLLIGHYWGAGIVLVCSTGFGLMPCLMKRTGSLGVAGNILLLILTIGFSGLCVVEGGLNGHAIAWLASVPLCSLLLLEGSAAGWWTAPSFSACSAIVALNLAGLSMKPAYDQKWENLVSSAGYLGFILFMFMLGVIFENSRKRAFAKMREAFADLETSNAELMRLDQEKNEFLGIAAHDLKNPLGVVIGTAELLRGCRDEKQHERMVGNIVGAGTRMLHLVKNLLDANAIEEGRFTSNLEPCDLQELVRECIDNNLTAATRKKIRLQLETKTPCRVKADRNATMQILDNLISNAVKYSPPDKVVHIQTATVGGGGGLLTVRDEGPGISEEDMKKMFGKFTRLSARPTGGESSNGLGLSIVKRLAEAMAGTVQCQSRLGDGATFILKLPAWKEPVHETGAHRGLSPDLLSRN
jgi:signal transduction histidine kinase